jgi:hypothetical protein
MSKPRVYTEEQKKANADAQRRRRKADPDKYREMGKLSERRRKVKRYGLTQESYAQMWTDQDKQCAICKVKEAPHGRFWHTDHCHTTGKVRGILCHHCNLMLGNARDSITNLENAISYLKETNV